MPAKHLNIITRAAIGMAFVLQITPVYALEFPDMEGQWYRYQDAVKYLVERDVLQGYPDGSFRPNQPINRAEFLKIVFKGRSSTEPVGRRCFSDVNPDAWYAPYVCTAERRGIVQGYANGTFQPEQNVKIVEAIKMVLNAYGKDIVETEGEHWYRPYVDYLDDNDILGKHSYAPGEELTRMRAADLITRLLRYDEEGIIPRYSIGCGKAKTAPPSSVTVHGEERHFLLTVPSSYIVHDPVPLLVAFHGRTNNNAEVRGYYRFDREATDAIIVYPAAKSNGNGSFAYGEDDVDFFDAIVKRLGEQYCIDMDRIFVAGHSLGGWFSNKIACDRGDVVRASASVGSSGYLGTCTGPAAAMLIHNPDDRLAPFEGSTVIRDARRERNSCSVSTHPISTNGLQCVEYEGCSINPVWFCPHENDVDGRGIYYPHNWPHGTGHEIWKFFTSLN